MKKIITILVVAVLITANLLAQAPQKMSYQAVVRDDNGSLVKNTQVGMKLNIRQDSVTGILVYTETQTPTTNDNGLLSIEIGGQAGFDTIDWANGPYFLETNIDVTGGTNYTITGTSQLLSVPYALHAKTADNIVSDTSKHYVGELWGGGIVYYVYDNGRHGLIASLDDLDGGSGVAWSNIDDKEIGASAKNYYKGDGNTTAIINQSGHTNSAAKLCADYTHDGFSDWYLPSTIELREMDAAIMVIYDVLANDGDTTTNPLHPEHVSPTYGRYWSSTEVDNNDAWSYRFDYGYSYHHSKDDTCRVRAVRAF